MPDKIGNVEKTTETMHRNPSTGLKCEKQKAKQVSKKQKTGSNEELVEGANQQLKEYAEQLKKLQTDIDNNNALSVKHGKMTLTFALNAGAILLEAKEIAPYGDWEKWVKENVPAISKRTAENYMKLAEEAADPKHVAFFDEAEGLREAYIKFGIIKIKSNPNASAEMTPKQMKEKDKIRYDVQLNAARQSAIAHVRKTIAALPAVNWSLSTWTVKNNKPCSGDESNIGALLFRNLNEWVAKRDFASSLIYEDEVTTKAGIVLAEVLKTIILASAAPQPEVADAIRNYSLELNRQPVAAAELAPV